jgi:hypothetical protein
MNKGWVVSRAELLASFYAAGRIAPTTATMVIVPASAAGLLLHAYGDARAALAAAKRMPQEPLWEIAASYLEALVAEQVPDTQPRLAKVEGAGR